MRRSHQMEIPTWTANDPNAVRCIWHLPIWWGTEFPIIECWQAVQGTGPNSNGNVSLAHDPGSAYAMAAGFPDGEAIHPDELNTMGQLPMTHGGAPSVWYQYRTPIIYKQDPNGMEDDCLIVAVETAGPVNEYLNAWVSIVADIPHADYSIGTDTHHVLWIEPGPNGKKLIRDRSRKNIQLRTKGGAEYRDGGVYFDGTSGYLTWMARQPEFTWFDGVGPRDFTIEFDFKSGLSNLQGGFVRHIFSGGVGADALAVTFMPGGKICVGTQVDPNPPTQSAVGYDDDQWRSAKIWRTGSTMHLQVDSHPEVTATDATLYKTIGSPYLGPQPCIGRYAGGGGHYGGNLRDFKVSRVARY